MKKYLLGFFCALMALPLMGQGLGSVSARFPGSYYFPNDTSTGTTVARLGKVNSGGSGVVITATSDTSGALGIVSSGAGTVGSALVTIYGPATCAFDGATTAGHYVSISSSTAGQCHDAGTSVLASSQILGIVEQTIGSTGNAALTLFGPRFVASGTRRSCSIIVGADNASSALVNGDLAQGQQCFVPQASTVIEVTVRADAGTPNVIPNRDRLGSVVSLLSSALATAGSGAQACSNAAGTTGIDGTTTCSSTLQNTSLSAGDWIGLASGTAGGTAKRMSISVTYSVN